LFIHILFLLLLVQARDVADPHQATALLQSGLLSLRQGDLANAQKSLEASSKLDPHNPYTWTSLAETYLRLNQPRQADSAARTAEKAAAGDPIVAHALAMFYSKTAQYSRAATMEKQYAESPKADKGALARAAGLYLNAGDPAQALPLAERASVEDASASSEDLLGRALIASGQTKDGTAHLGSAWTASKNDPQIAFDYAQALLHAQDFTRAADVLDEASKSNPRNAQLTLALGVARYGQRRFEEAISAFLETIHTDPRIPQSYLFLGRLLDQAGDRLPAITAIYREWLKAEPRHAEPPLLLAKALLASNVDSPEPETLLRHSIQLDSKNWESHYELGLVLSKKREYQAASVELNRSAELAPREPLPHYHLARIYDRLGDKSRAESERAIHKRLSETSSPSPANNTPNR
jgi:Flp pilus assembly protein TadD